jgi:poly [ADP-ribose] polymerase
LCFFQDVSNYKKRHVAIKGLGRKTTDEKEYIKWHNNITVPCGSLIESSHKDGPLEYNEYCVYNPKQVSA